MTIVPKIQVATRKPHTQTCAVFGGKSKVSIKENEWLPFSQFELGKECLK